MSCVFQHDIFNLHTFHTISGSSSIVEIVEIVDKEKGTFIIKDWSDYPDDYILVHRIINN